MTDWRHAKRAQLKIIVPILISCLAVYFSWVYSYYICWNEIYKHHSKSTGIGLIIGNILFVLLIYGTWMMILVIGPGKQPKIPLFRIVQNVDETGYHCIDPPEYFMCSPDGYPIYCSECQSIKIDRSHHSSDLGHCVPRMDHFCTFLGAVIGKDNYHLFIQYCWWCLCYFVYIGVSMACFTKQYKERRGSVNPNIIIVYIFAIGWILMVFALFTSHMYYIYTNKTSIDDMRRKRNRRANTIYDEYVSLKHNDKRYILRINPDKENIWNKGFKLNWVEMMGSSPIRWLTPLGRSPQRFGISDDGNLEKYPHLSYEEIVGEYMEKISGPCLESLHKRIESQDYIAVT